MGIDPDEGPRSYPHVTRKGILIGYYGFWERTSKELIDRRKIGAKDYNSANASVYRAINRLESRGLIRRLEESGTRLQLTDSGVAVARQLVLEESQS